MPLLAIRKAILPDPPRLLWAALVCVLAWGPSACTSSGRAGDPPPAPPVDVDYAALVARYNANIDGLDQLWARAVVEARWREGEQRRFEQGEGNLLMVLPDRLALSIGKLGNTLLWAGCDDRRSWLFDLSSQPTTLYVARHGESAATLAVHPLDLPKLLGVVRIDAALPPAAPAVEWVDGACLVEPPGMAARLLLDRATALPLRIVLLDGAGRPTIEARLAQHERVRMQATAPLAQARVASRIEIASLEGHNRMVLHLSDLSDGRDSGKLHPRAFDLARLVWALKPARIEGVIEDLDPQTQD